MDLAMLLDAEEWLVYIRISIIVASGIFQSFSTIFQVHVHVHLTLILEINLKGWKSLCSPTL